MQTFLKTCIFSTFIGSRVEIARFLLGSTLGPDQGSLAWPWVVFLNGTSSGQAREVAKKFLKFMAGGV